MQLVSSDVIDSSNEDRNRSFMRSCGVTLHGNISSISLRVGNIPCSSCSIGGDCHIGRKGPGGKSCRWFHRGHFCLADSCGGNGSWYSNLVNRARGSGSGLERWCPSWCSDNLWSILVVGSLHHYKLPFWITACRGGVFYYIFFPGVLSVTMPTLELCYFLCVE